MTQRTIIVTATMTYEDVTQFIAVRFKQVYATFTYIESGRRYIDRHNCPAKLIDRDTGEVVYVKT